MSEAQLREAYTLMKQGDKQAAIRLVQDVLREDRSNLNAWWLFSHLLEDEDKIVKSLEKVLSLNPEHIGARKRLAQMRPEYAHLAPDFAEMPGGRKGKAGIPNPGQKKVSKTGLLAFLVVVALSCLATLSFPIITTMMDANALANIEGPPPEEVAFLQVTAAFNGDYETMRFYTCDSLEDEWIELMNDMSSEVERTGLGLKDIDFDFSGLNLEVLEDNGRQIIYRVTGEMLMEARGQHISVDVEDISGFEPRMVLVVNDNHWTVCSL
jgi:hypothetical protein